MPTTVPVTSFDYTSLDLDTASFVRQQTGELKALMQRAAHDIFEIGQKLIEVKEKLGHGNYLSWLEAEFAWTDRTARNYTNVAKQFKSETVSELPLAPSALFILAAPSTSEEIREEAIARAKKGEPITKKKATQLKRSQHSSREKKASLQEEETLHLTDFPTASRELEIIDAELESPPAQDKREIFQPPSPALKTSTVPQTEPRQQPPEEIKALPPSPPYEWWRLTGKEQKHLLFNGHPDDSNFLASLPDKVGVWLGSPPTPDEWLYPPKGRVKTAFSYSTIYKGVNLNAIRQLIEGLINETSSEDDKTAMLAYLPDAPLLLLFDDFGLDCYIAEPDEAQCQEILKTWKLLGGKVEKIDNLEFGAV